MRARSHSTTVHRQSRCYAAGQVQCNASVPAAGVRLYVFFTIASLSSLTVPTKRVNAFKRVVNLQSLPVSVVKRSTIRRSWSSANRCTYKMSVNNRKRLQSLQEIGFEFSQFGGRGRGNSGGRGRFGRQAGRPPFGRQQNRHQSSNKTNCRWWRRSVRQLRLSALRRDAPATTWFTL